MGEVKLYTRADVAIRDGCKGEPVWIIYKDSVYDLTKYVDEHPGGSESVLEEAGKDATKAFEDVGHSSDARTVILKYKIGEIVQEEKRYDENGKLKKKRVAAAKPDDKPNTRSCFNIITCGLIG